MTTGTELMLQSQPTRRDELLDILEDVWRGGTAPKQALGQIEEMMQMMAQTARDCAALTSFPRSSEFNASSRQEG